MPTEAMANADQIALWNGPGGSAWTDTRDVLDRMFAPFEDLLCDPLPAAPSPAALDVGCGTGAVTLALARRLPGDGWVAGIDVSAPMIEVARARAEKAGLPVDFVLADAQTHHFPSESVDLIISRFGVMFFDDPVAAFANLRQAAKPEGRLRFAAWRSLAENAFMTAAERAVAPHLPNLPARDPNAPGQFAFADPDRIHGILSESGWTGIEIRPVDVVCSFAERDLAHYFTRLGPVGLVLREADAATRARVIETIRAAFDPFVAGDEVRTTAACWLVEATAR